MIHMLYTHANKHACADIYVCLVLACAYRIKSLKPSIEEIPNLWQHHKSLPQSSLLFSLFLGVSLHQKMADAS